MEISPLAPGLLLRDWVLGLGGPGTLTLVCDLSPLALGRVSDVETLPLR